MAMKARGKELTSPAAIKVTRLAIKRLEGVSPSRQAAKIEEAGAGVSQRPPNLPRQQSLYAR
jgi:hypothetical protein